MINKEEIRKNPNFISLHQIEDFCFDRQDVNICLTNATKAKKLLNKIANDKTDLSNNRDEIVARIPAIMTLARQYFDELNIHPSVQIVLINKIAERIIKTEAKIPHLYERFLNPDIAMSIDPSSLNIPTTEHIITNKNHLAVPIF